MTGELPVNREKCATCPFRMGSKYAHLAPALAESALSQASRICHSTGSNNGINYRTGKSPALCRGARDIQLGWMVCQGFLPEATDKAWAEKWNEMKKATPVKRRSGRAKK